MARRPEPPRGEFATIARVFAPLAGQGAFGLRDDAARVRPRKGQDLVITTDALVAGVHFLETDPPQTVARKLLRVNLSDLIAKGALPRWYLLTTAWPRQTEAAWIAAFGQGLKADQARFGLALLGGDTVATAGPMALSCTMLGEVPRGRMVHRAGARPGDLVAVTGTLGDAALGLLVARGERLGLPQATAAALLRRYRVPKPPFGIERLVRAGAHAAIDVSDGLVADLGHVAETSRLGATLRAADLPLSPAVRSALRQDPLRRRLVLAGGDDYQTLLTAPPAVMARLRRRAAHLGLALTVIGAIHRGQGVRVLDADGAALALERTGYTHF